MPLNTASVHGPLQNRVLRSFDSIDTTMREAAGCPAGTVVIAEEQTAGQGRHGHKWHSEKGSGLYLSVVLPREPAPALTLALGLATAEAITTTTGIPCDLRWPNDVMIGHRKAAGIREQPVEPAASVVTSAHVKPNH